MAVGLVFENSHLPMQLQRESRGQRSRAAKPQHLHHFLRRHVDGQLRAQHPSRVWRKRRRSGRRRRGIEECRRSRRRFGIRFAERRSPQEAYGTSSPHTARTSSAGVCAKPAQPISHNSHVTGVLPPKGPRGLQCSLEKFHILPLNKK